MKLKSGILKVVKKWHSDVAILRQKHKLLVVMRDNAGEQKVHKKLSTSSSQWESRTIRALNKSNGRMDFLKQQSISP